MKISSVEIYLMTGKEPKNNGHQRPILVRVNTDEGIYGDGEGGTAYGNACNGLFGQIRDFAKLVIGWDPMKTEAIWDHLYRDTFWGQGGGTVIFSAMSAIDMALWDIKGKVLGVPVYQLLGGKTNKKLRAYASQIQFGWGEKLSFLGKPKEYAEAAVKCVEDGYDAVKVDPFAFDAIGRFGTRNTGLLTHDKLTLYHDRIAAIREAVGPAVDIIIECHTGLDVNSAIQFGKTVEDLNIYYMEEVCTPLNPPLTEKVKEKINIPLAGGERIYTRFGFRPFFENRSLDVIQPDLANCGGISEGKKVCDMAHAYEIAVQLHICGGPMSYAAALQVQAAIPNFCIHEHHVVYLDEFHRRLGKYDYQPVNGSIEVPDLPGLGQEISMEAVKDAEKVVVDKKY